VNGWVSSETTVRYKREVKVLIIALWLVSYIVMIDTIARGIVDFTVQNCLVRLIGAQNLALYCIYFKIMYRFCNQEIHICDW
jgi:hypothetical protein